MLQNTSNSIKFLHLFVVCSYVLSSSPCILLNHVSYLVQIAYSLIEDQEGRTRLRDDYISFVGLLADPRYCGSVVLFVIVSIEMVLVVVIFYNDLN